MNPSDSPYRNSIWEHDSRYDVDISLSPSILGDIARLASVDAAKKNIPPVPPGSLQAIAAAARAMPAATMATPTDIETYLANQLVHPGAGVPTLICMLAVISNGDYPPFDRKFALGMKEMKKITGTEHLLVTKVKSIGKKQLSKLAEVYVKKIIPAWRESLENRTNKEADEYWGRSGQTPK